VEFLSNNPPVAIYHDVIYDEEIRAVKEVVVEKGVCSRRITDLEYRTRLFSIYNLVILCCETGVCDVIDGMLTAAVARVFPNIVEWLPGGLTSEADRVFRYGSGCGCEHDHRNKNTASGEIIAMVPV
jgi:hypothetical protein